MNPQATFSNENKSKPVNLVNNMEELRYYVHANPKVVLFVGAHWSGPSKMIEPFVQTLAERYPDVQFLKTYCGDGYDNEDIFVEYKIRFLPTFLFFRNQAHEATLMTANKQIIEDVLDDLFRQK